MAIELLQTLSQGMIEFTDPASGEIVHAIAPVYLKEDFHGGALSARWTVTNNGLGFAGLFTDANNGSFRLHEPGTGAADGSLNWGVLSLNVFDGGGKAHMRVTVDSLPSANGEIVWGVASGYNATFDSMTYNAWFKLAGSGALLLETDDGTNDNDDQDTGVTLTAQEWNWYTIDFSDISSVKFLMNGARLLPGTTFDMSSTSGQHLQPMFALKRTSGSEVLTAMMDSFSAWSLRAD